ncbi:MAG TPA: GntR family transcriptional regulator [Acidimicrobiia bacterium]|nr:GntR family transcriptional regulator [Acidimicrobiia bacterium]
MPALPKYDEGAARGTLAMSVADELREAILDGYADGELIGSEDDLVARFGVSRPTLRQAIRMLQTDGLVTVRRGNSGGFFAATPSVHTVARAASLLLRQQGATTDHLDEVSRITSPAVAALAADNPDVHARAAFLEFTEASWGNGVVTLGDGVWLAAEFGRRLGELSANPALALFSATMSELVWTKVRALGQDDQAAPVATAQFLAGLREAHDAIAHAVADGDAARARGAAQLLSDLHRRLVVGLAVEHPGLRES